MWRARPERQARSRRAAPPANWRRTLYRRLVVIGCGFAAWIAAVETRLVHLQIVQHDVLEARARDQHLRTVPLHPKRGEILDRNGRVLAYSVDTDTVFAVPAEIQDPDRTAEALCAALDDCPAELRGTIADRLRRRNAFAYVKRQVTPEEARRVAALGLQGVGFLTEDRPVLPQRGAGRAPPRLRRHRQPGVERHRVDLRRGDQRQHRTGAGADRRPPPGVQPPRAAADRGRHRRADDRQAPPAHRRARAPRGHPRLRGGGRRGRNARSAHRRGAGAGERAHLQSERVRRGVARPAPEPRRPGRLRARVDVQDRDRRGGVRGAGRRSGRGVRRERRLDPGRPRPHSRLPPLRPSVVHRRHREVEQRRRPFWSACVSGRSA